jgi:hypothetical protein
MIQLHTGRYQEQRKKLVGNSKGKFWGRKRRLETIQNKKSTDRRYLNVDMLFRWKLPKHRPLVGTLVNKAGSSRTVQTPVVKRGKNCSSRRNRRMEEQEEYIGGGRRMKRKREGSSMRGRRMHKA